MKYYKEFTKYKVPGYVLTSIVQMREMALKGNTVGIGALIGEIFAFICEEQLEEIE